MDLRIQHENVLISTALPMVMHIDLNSCFAIIEQQSNRLLRNRPVGVSAYDTPRGFVLAASYEAKRKGVKLGVNVEQSRALAPGIVIMTPDPAKYREAHKLFKALMLEYTPDVSPKSIDEFVLDFSHAPSLLTRRAHVSHAEGLQAHNQIMRDIALEIKQKIRERLGEWVTVNIGIAPNRFLAKYAAGFDKPNGMTIIDHTNLRERYMCRTPHACASLGAARSNGPRRIRTYGEGSGASGQAQNSQDASGVSGPARKQAGGCEECGGMNLVDLPGINVRYRARLRAAGIYTPLEFLNADMVTLKKRVFKSINGYHWYMRLRGHEVGADTVEFSRKRIGHQYALKDKTTDLAKLEKLLLKLCEKTGRRMRKNEYYASGIHLYLGFLNEQQHEGPASFENMPNIRSWSHGEKVHHRLYSTADIYAAAKKLLHEADITGRVRIMAVHVYDLAEWDPVQLSLFEAKQDVGTKQQTLEKQPLRSVEETVRSVEVDKRLSDAVDAVNNRYGEFVITPALMMEMQGTILDRVAFGQVRDV